MAWRWRGATPTSPTGRRACASSTCANPAAPDEVGFYDTPGYAYGVAVAGSYAYVADDGAGLRIINVANPARPTRSGSTTRQGMPMAWRWRAATPTSPTGMRGLRIINVANPAAPDEVGFYDTPGYAYGVAVAGSYAYVADGG